MKLLPNALTCTLLLSASAAAHAQWQVAGGYSHVARSPDELGAVSLRHNTDDVSLSVIYGSIGYRYDYDALTIMPELRMGTGINDDTFALTQSDMIFRIKAEVDYYAAASIRAQYRVSDTFSVFLQPSLAKWQTSTSPQRTEVFNDWEFGGGGGATYHITNILAVDALYEVYQGTNALSVAVSYRF